MTSRDSNAVRYRLQDALEFWGERWVLDGQQVTCPGCLTEQLAQDARAPFMHADGCPLATEFAQQPWVELRDLLADLPTVPA
jgi:hypothetical protein